MPFNFTIKLKIQSINKDKKTTYETHIALNIRKQTPINETVLEQSEFNLWQMVVVVAFPETIC